MPNMVMTARRDPFAAFDTVIRRAFPAPTRWTLGPIPGPAAVAFSPAVEIVKDGDDALVRVDLPGVDLAKDVTVELDRGAPGDSRRASGRARFRGDRSSDPARDTLRVLPPGVHAARAGRCGRGVRDLRRRRAQRPGDRGVRGSRTAEDRRDGQFGIAGRSDGRRLRHHGRGHVRRHRFAELSRTRHAGRSTGVRGCAPDRLVGRETRTEPPGPQPSVGGVATAALGRRPVGQ